MKRQRVFVVFLLLPLLILACKDDTLSNSAPNAAATQITASPLPLQEATLPVATVAPPTATTIPPTPTPAEPLAALVNETPVFLSTYEKELARYEQAQAELGTPLDAGDTSYRAQVLDTIIERTLIAQAAEQQGIEITSEMVDEKLNELRIAAGGADNFAAWLEANQWTEVEFHEALAAEMLTEQVVTMVTADVPFTVEQVRARYIQVDEASLAQSLLEQLRAGADFAFLAEQNSLDRITAQNGGDLGFFARGSLLVPEVEEAAFALAPGEVSEVISVTNQESGQTTYYLVQLLERDEQRPLTADMRYSLLQETFETWLDNLWQQATIVRYVNIDA